MAAMIAASSAAPAYAFDCEFIQVKTRTAMGVNQAEPQPTQRVVCSIGVVDNRLEKILYARIKKPLGSEVVDDSFVRTRGGLHPDWDKGVSLFVARQLLGEFASGGGVLVGWQIDADLGAMRFDEAAGQARDHETFPPFGRRADVPLEGPVTAALCDLTDVYRTATRTERNPHGQKASLGEAYREVFGRSLVAHDAGDDALMTMELYKHWVGLGQPQRIELTGLQFYVVNAHSFSSPEQRAMLLWAFLRPRSRDRDVVIEHDDMTNCYQLKFRLAEEREAFLLQVQRAIGEFGDSTVASWGDAIATAKPAGSYSIPCTSFTLHVYDKPR